jgi:MarR family 2-MHQ and catechol resistance regulon transcriptional repressor
MPNRKQHAETILRSFRLARLALAAQSLPAGARNGSKTSKQGKKNSVSPAQWSLLSLLVENGEMSNQDIAAALSITSGAVTQLVDALVMKNYLIREAAPDDRRRLALKISPKYKRHIGDMMAKGLERAMVIFEGFTDAEMATYAALGRKFTDRVQSLSRREP